MIKKLETEKLEQAAEVFKGFGNPIRIRIIDALRSRNLRVMEISDQLGYSQPIISQQLKILKSAGIVHNGDPCACRQPDRSRFALAWWKRIRGYLVRCLRHPICFNYRYIE